jgi:3-hydroxymyristoyl/3-hydroxydecanoyl-(acyl carrier protein) dehydratase
MVEDSVGTAIKGFTDADPVLGGVIILLMLAQIATYRFLNSIIRELKADLIAERAAHQITREAQIEDIRTLGHVAHSVDGLRNSMAEMHGTIRDVLVRKAG